MKLFGYWHSSATWRVRIAMALKEISYDYEPVNLLNADHLKQNYIKRNPQGLVPSLETDDGQVLTQSLAIIQYLDQRFPSTPLVSSDPVKAAQINAIAIMIASEAQPFGNLRVLNYLQKELHLDEDQIKAWMNRFVTSTLEAVERLLPDQGEGQNPNFAFDNRPGLAEIFIIPQCYAARRRGAKIDHLKKLVSIEKKCENHPAFIKAHPSTQPDNPANS